MFAQIKRSTDQVVLTYTQVEDVCGSIIIRLALYIFESMFMWMYYLKCINAYNYYLGVTIDHSDLY